jgi:WD40 repeat protein/predicted Ser/Thr protein kinase
VESFPQRFGGYELLDRIGQGGMGVVYRARQVSLDRIVAVKVLPHGALATKEQVLRFRTEAAAAGSLQHPNIVAIHEVGLCEDRHFLVMDFVEGQTLAELARDGPLSPRRAARYVQMIAEAVHHAHQHGILHRDLKPSNVLIDADDQPRVTDFGLAKRLESGTDLTLSGQVLGSPQYMPPEQAAGRHRQVGPRGDVYALGAILYHLLTGRPPFVGETFSDILPQVANDEPLRPRQLNPAIPPDLETICLKCLGKEIHRRYPTALALAEELGRFLRGEPIVARPVSVAGKVWRWCRRKPQVATAIGGAVLIAFAGLTGIVWQWRRATAGELFARQNAYAADMMLAQHALADNDVRLATRLLDKYGPKGKSDVRSPKSEVDLRGWEWRYLWRLCHADQCVSLQTNSGSLGPMAISQDGRVLAAQKAGGKIGVWDLTSKRLMTEVPVPAEIRALALSRSGRLSALSTSASEVHQELAVEVWDLGTGQRRASFQHSAPVRSLVFSPDDTLLATFDDQGTVALLDWTANHTLTNFTVPPPGWSRAGVVAFSRDGARLAVGRDWDRVDLLEWRTGKVVTMTNLTGPTDYVSALAFAPVTDLLAAGAGSGKTIRLWKFSSEKPEGGAIITSANVTALAFNSDGRVLASASGDQTIQLWSVADQAQLRSWRGHPGEGQALAFGADGQTLVSGCKEGGACFWDVNAASRLWGHATLTNSYELGSEAAVPATNFIEAPGHMPGPLDPKLVRRFGFAFMPDSRKFITTDRDGWLGVWDAQTVRLLERLPELGSNLWGVALSPNGRWLATGRASGAVEIWDWQSRTAITNHALPFGWLGKILFSRSGKFLLAGSGFRGDVVLTKVWRTSDWAEVALAPAQVARLRSAALSPDDRHLAVGHYDGAVKVWSFPGGRLEAAFTNHTGSVSQVLFSQDGRALISASLDGSVRFWDLGAGRQTTELRGHLGGVWDAALSPDGRRLATGGSSAKDAVKLWDLATQRELLTLQGEGTLFFHVAFSPDGSMLAGTSFLGVAHLWRAPSGEEIAAAESESNGR